MWSIVLFEKDNTVEAIPTNWFKDGLYAWPKKDERVKINCRIQPNKFDFDFYPARLLKKKCGEYTYKYIFIFNKFYIFIRSTINNNQLILFIIIYIYV